jgi:hypothetical protein
MPFSDEFNWVFEDLIEPALSDAGYEVIRADTVVDQQSIMRDIVEGIIRCDLTIVEITSLNPNVMYELGMAHALRRPTIILTQDVSNGPFDLRAYRLIQYSEQYREVVTVKDKLTEIATKHKLGEIKFTNPVIDFAPPEFWKGELAQPPIEATTDVVDSDGEYEGRLGLLDLEQLVSEQLEIIGQQATRLVEITHDFAQNSNARTERINELNELENQEASKQRRLLVISTANLITRWGEDMEQELPPIREAWSKLEEYAEGFAASASIESERDRLEAEKFVETMEEFGSTIRGVVESLGEAKSSISPLRTLSRDLDRAGHRASRSLDSVVEALSIGEPFAARLVNIVKSRLEDEPDATGTGSGS